MEQFLSVNCESVIYALSILSVAALFLLYYFRWRDLLLPYVLIKRKAESGSSDQSEETLPRLSVIVPANDETELLRLRLPQLLQQNYPNFEVIVVDESASVETKELLEQLQLQHRNLRCSFIPSTATDICRRKLAITLGMRAARSEWAVITTASAVPVSLNWLRSLAECMDDATDVVLGYANYVNDGSPLARRAILERLWMQLRCCRSAYGYGAIGGDECNFCIRKQTFLDHNGYADNLQVSFGESHLLIDSLSEQHNVRIALSPESIVRDELPLEAIWKNMRIYYREILYHSSRRTRFYLMREGFASLLMYLFLLLTLGYIGMRVVQMAVFHDFNPGFIGLDVLQLLLLLAYLLVPVLFLRKTTRLLGEVPNGWGIVRHQLCRPFVNAYLKIKRWDLRKDFV